MKEAAEELFNISQAPRGNFLFAHAKPFATKTVQQFNVRVCKTRASTGNTHNKGAGRSLRQPLVILRVFQRLAVDDGQRLSDERRALLAFDFNRGFHTGLLAAGFRFNR